MKQTIHQEEGNHSISSFVPKLQNKHLSEQKVKSEKKKKKKNKKKTKKEKDLKFSEQSSASSICTETSGRTPNSQHY